MPKKQQIVTKYNEVNNGEKVLVVKSEFCFSKTDSIFKIFGAKPKVSVTEERTIEAERPATFEDNQKLCNQVNWITGKPIRVDEITPPKIVARIDVGYQNALYISGNHSKLGNWQKAIRLECKSTNTWELPIDFNVLNTEFKFLIGPYSLGNMSTVEHLNWETCHNRITKSGLYEVDRGSFEYRSNVYRF